MDPRKKTASVAAKVMVLLGVLPLAIGLMGAMAMAHRGDLTTYWPVIAVFTTGGGALVAGALAMDRWACRQPSDDERGFEVVVDKPAADAGGRPPSRSDP